MMIYFSFSRILDGLSYKNAFVILYGFIMFHPVNWDEFNYRCETIGGLRRP